MQSNAVEDVQNGKMVFFFDNYAETYSPGNHTYLHTNPNNQKA